MKPDWPAPFSVRSCITTRYEYLLSMISSRQSLPSGGVGQEQCSARARRALAQQLGLPYGIQWLRQVHGATVVESRADGRIHNADACWTRHTGVACAVLTADCLPVLFAARDGSVVAAAHAGWRGLVRGVLPATIRALNATAPLMAYLGPAICARHFEVDAPVKQAFLEARLPGWDAARIEDCFAAGRSPGYFQADLFRLARAQLVALGVSDIYGGSECTYGDVDRYYSHRRGQDRGRMASVIWLAGSN